MFSVRFSFSWMLFCEVIVVVLLGFLGAENKCKLDVLFSRRDWSWAEGLNCVGNWIKSQC